MIDWVLIGLTITAVATSLFYAHIFTTFAGILYGIGWVLYLKGVYASKNK